jgi:hypothetical protein
MNPAQRDLFIVPDLPHQNSGSIKTVSTRLSLVSVRRNIAYLMRGRSMFVVDLRSNLTQGLHRKVTRPKRCKCQ